MTAILDSTDQQGKDIQYKGKNERKMWTQKWIHLAFFYSVCFHGHSTFKMPVMRPDWTLWGCVVGGGVPCPLKKKFKWGDGKYRLWSQADLNSDQKAKFACLGISSWRF